VISAAGALTTPSSPPMIVVESDDRDAAEGSSRNPWPGGPLHVLAGQVAVVTGPAGCGKSHLLRAAAGLSLVPGRRVLVAGHELGSMPHRARRRAAAGMRLFYLPQEAPLLSNLTVLENLLLPIRYLGEREEKEALAEAGDLLRAMGIGWAAGELPARLSDEDRRTAAIIRGFLRRPAVALLDDPLSGLDEASLAGALPLIRSALQSWGCAILAAAPDMDGFEGLPAVERAMPPRRAQASPGDP
jgi:ABC-type lipoprotein export system ATPase subunit